MLVNYLVFMEYLPMINRCYVYGIKVKRDANLTPFISSCAELNTTDKMIENCNRDVILTL